MSKHKYLKEEEFEEIKQALSKGKQQREIAFKYGRSDQLVRQVKVCQTFINYQMNYQPSTIRIMHDKPSYDLPEMSEPYGWVKDILDKQAELDDMLVIQNDRLNEVNEKLDALHREFNALKYLLRRELK